MKLRNCLTALCVAAMLAACGSKKNIVGDTPQLPADSPAVADSPQHDDAKAARQQRRDYLARVRANEVDTKNVTAKIDFSLQTGSKDITVGGKLQMRRDDVIRIQLQVPVIGMEAGRMEFTKDYVMIVDRIHAEYIKGDYNEVDFLRDNGINFSVLQALFWNQLFVPGADSLTDALLDGFTVEPDAGAQTTLVSLLRGKFSYLFETEQPTALIRKTTVDYREKTGDATQLTCSYDDFRKFGGAQFPATITLDMSTTATKKAKHIKLGIRAKSLSADDNWETRTTLSKKYKPVSVDEVMKKLTSL